ncbi:TOMM system kinase/cyclase fusion protein [Sorangium sp. So ce542]|uniref:TOMM system kinase/cyclase fusion protein n=1 Tax=Sorangium sp. So ce542 TaxID=3133316 RepID=UPI003F5D5D05
MSLAEEVGAALKDRYEILTELGRGGYATVYKARQLATDQQVAIKVLRLPDGGDAEANEQRIARFQGEMRLCAKMHHPNIVRLLDSGRAEGDIVYSVFELVPGKDLAHVLAAEGRLAPLEARHLMMQVLDALACAHAEGVIHRDLKPANIMITPTGARRNALVLDFGIGALTEEAWSDDRARVTLTHESVGTPAYAAPEQLRNQPATPRSDLYAWGLVLMECITGRRVVGGETMAEMAAQQLSPDPVPIPDELADHPLGSTLRRVTAKDPEARDVTASGLLLELETCDVSALQQRIALTLAGTVASEGRAIAAELGDKLGRDGPPSRLIEGERRQITAVSCSLTASSAGPGATDTDADELDQLLGVQQAACTAIARRFDGHIAGALGDTVLYYFGYPTAREDDARRAARVALAMAAEVRRSSAALEAERQVRIEARIGIHTGLVVTRELREQASADHGYIMGATPKVASRLSAMAEPGTIVVSGDAHRLLRKQFSFEQAGACPVDGGAPVDVFLLRGDSSQGIRDLPLVGRERELDLLLSSFAQVCGGTGQAVLLTGEPGIGKSHLSRALRQQIGAGDCKWLECRCTPDSANSALHPIIDLIERELDLRTEAAPEGRLDRLEALLSRYGFDVEEAVPLFAVLLSLPLPERWKTIGVSSQKQREMIRNAVLSLLFEMAERQPVVLAMEDLHWADPSTLELLGHLVGELPSARLLALFSARPEFTPAWSPKAALQIQLGRMGRREVELMSMKITGGRALSPSAIDLVASRTDGVPLFVEELVLMMLESGALVERDGRYALSGPLSSGAIPASLRDLLVARLDRLGRAKETAQLAAAIGREFSFDLLREASPLAESDVQEDLDKLVAADLVYHKRRLKKATYLFKHALVRDAAYDSMLKRSRQGVHGRIVRALEGRFPEVALERPDLLAQHHAAAEQKRQALGYAHKAAMAALMSSANAEAANFAREALGWLDAIPDERERAEIELQLNAVLSPALMALRGYAAAEIETLVARSQQLLGPLGGHPLAFATRAALFTYHHLRGHRDEALRLARENLEHAERAGERGQQAAALAHLGESLFLSGYFADARAALERVRDVYDPEEHRSLGVLIGLDPRVHAGVSSELLLCLLGLPDAGLAAGRATLAWARDLKHVSSICTALLYLVGAHHYRRELAEMEGPAAELAEIGERLGLDQWRLLAGAFLGYVRRDPEAMRGVLAITHGIGIRQARPYFLSMAAECEMHHGRFDAALELVTTGLQLADEMRERYWVPELHRLRGVLLAARDASAAGEAEQSLRRAIAIAREQGARLPELRAAVQLARLLRGTERAAEAKATLEAVWGSFTEGFDTPDGKEAQGLLRELSHAG